MKPTLVILAAGMGTRYGGLKQLDPVGPGGEVVMDYSVFDAKRAGFDRVVFVIRPDIEKAFHDEIGSKLSKYIQVDYVFQTLDNIPDGFQVPEGRAKPWGTAHAVLVAREKIDTPFAVINADDFYGKESFAVLGRYLETLPNDSTAYSMVGFELRKTLSDYGAVARGICQVEEGGYLLDVEEFTKIEKRDGQIVDGTTSFSGMEKVSMNCWGFTPAFFDAIESHFKSFFETSANDPKAEMYIPTVVAPLIPEKKASVCVLETSSQWFGVTYADDKPFVVKAIQKLVDEGLYPDNLWQN